MRMSSQTQSKTPPKTFAEFLALCQQPTPDNAIKQREGYRDRQGNMHMLDYVEWHYVADFLDENWPTWEHHVDSLGQVGDTCYCVASITINGITRQGVGTGTATSEMGIKKAEHDALKRAAVKFGIARDLYQSEDHDGRPTDQRPAQRQQSSGQQRSAPPPQRTQGQSTSGADQITPKQLGFAKQLARDLGKDPDELADEWSKGMVQSVEDFSKQEARGFIDWLKEYRVF
jgi:hypothetical protein